MKICMFAGHRLVHQPCVEERLNATIEALLCSDSVFQFLTGGMGEFDWKAEAVVRGAKRRHPELNIRLILVAPYMSNAFNTKREHYEEKYDDIIIPTELAGVHYKAVIKMRNQWMVERSDILLAYVCRNFGGAAETLRYARRNQSIQIINIAQ